MLTKTALALCLLVQVLPGSMGAAVGSSSSDDPTACTGWPFTEFIFSTQPGTTDLLSEVDMNHPFVLEQEQYELDSFPSTGQIVEVVPGRVYQAEGYDLGYPAVFITPEDTLILIDAPESYTIALTILADFRAIPAIGTKPFAALVVTIFHVDHIWGMKAFADDPYNQGSAVPLIWNEKTPIEAEKFEAYKAFKSPRLVRQFGLLVPKPWHLHDVVTQRVSFTPGPMGNVILDNMVFNGDDKITRTIGGMDLVFTPLPGYTVDQIMVYIPEHKILHIADVFYYSFPNIYTLRGEPARSAKDWADSKHKAANYPDVDILMGTHLPHIVGADILKTKKKKVPTATLR